MNARVFRRESSTAVRRLKFDLKHGRRVGRFIDARLMVDGEHQPTCGLIVKHSHECICAVRFAAGIPAGAISTALEKRAVKIQSTISSFIGRAERRAPRELKVKERKHLQRQLQAFRKLALKEMRSGRSFMAVGEEYRVCLDHLMFARVHYEEYDEGVRMAN